MTRPARFLHITDTHMVPGGSPLKLDDRKVDPQLEPQTREDSFELALMHLAERLTTNRQELDGVIFSGDALSRGVPGGDALLLDLILKHLAPHGIGPGKVVAVPGNHDVPKGAAAGSGSRYEAFITAWRDRGCITPWLDGTDSSKPDPSKHILLAPDNAWAIIAVNSSNWSHVDAIPKTLASIWAAIPAKLAEGNPEMEKAIREELTSLARYDMARVSPQQLEAIAWMLKNLAPPAHGKQLKMMALHHHLRAPSVAEEVKPFADLSNLEQVRTFIAQQDVRVVMHGHKHAGRVHSDFVELRRDQPPHKVLMVAGSSFDAQSHDDAMRLLELNGVPFVPSLRVVPLPIPRRGLNSDPGNPIETRLWSPSDSADDAPTVIQGTDFDEVYARVVEAAKREAKDGTLIVQLDLADTASLERLPAGYPTNIADEAGRTEWLSDLVQWWQLPQSQLQARVPYIHGTRLHNYANNLDQIERARHLLANKQTTRAIALLVDPAVDFREAPVKADFASFCLVQFSRREEGGRVFIDCVGYYRAQEMVKWWPINVAELQYLQVQVGKDCGGKPGRITTITACARSAARAPTHVAMPVVDRWLDQAPEKYFILASALLSEQAMAAEASKVLREWIEALDELRVAAVEPSPDGGPVVAIEGPAMLAKYLRSGTGPRASRCRELAVELDEIVRIGKLLSSPHGRGQQQAWSEQLASLLGRVADYCRLLEN